MHPVHIQKVFLADTMVLYFFRKTIRFVTTCEIVRKTEKTEENAVYREYAI